MPKMEKDIRTYDPGKYLFFQGEQVDRIYILKSGKLQVFVTDAAGRAPRKETLINEIDKENTIIGEIGAILNEPRSASVRVSADGPATLMAIETSGEDFLQRAAKIPSLGLAMLKNVVRQCERILDFFIESDRLVLSSHAALNDFSRNLYEIVAALERCAEKRGNELRAAGSVRDSLLCRLGLIGEKYDYIPLDIFLLVEMNFDLHGRLFKNSLFSPDAGGAVGVGAPAPMEGAEVVVFKSGQIVCPEGGVDKTIYFLREGRLEVFAGARRLETIDRKGCVFGEGALLENRKRTTSVRALGEVEAVAIPAARIAAGLGQDGKLMSSLLVAAAEKLRSLNTPFLMTTFRTKTLADFMGAGTVNCLKTMKGFLPLIQREAEQLGDDVRLAPILAGKICNELALSYAGIAARYRDVCKGIGAVSGDAPETPSLFNASDSEFTVIEDLKKIGSLGADNVNFAINPVSNRFLACVIEAGHDALLKRAGGPRKDENDFVLGRIHKFGDSFPNQIVTIDSAGVNGGRHEPGYMLRALNLLLKNSEQEIAITYNEGNCREILYVPEQIRLETPVEAAEITAPAAGAVDEIRAELRDSLKDVKNPALTNACFWRLCAAAVKGRLPAFRDNRIPFTEDELMLLDFGLFDEGRAAAAGDIRTEIKRDARRVRATEPECFCLSEMMNKAGANILGHVKLDELDRDKKRIEKEIENHEKNMAAITEERAKIIALAGVQTQPFVRKHDAHLREMANVFRRAQQAQLTAAEFQDIKSKREEMDALRQQVGKLVAAARGKAPREQIVRFHSLGAALENEVNREIDMRGLLARKEAEIRKHKDEMAAADMDEKNALVDEEVRRYKNLADLLSKEAETAPMPVAARGSAPVTKTRIAEVIGALLSEENDPRIFDASPALTRIYGKPSVLLLPSRGVAIYERDRNMIIVPVTPRDTLEEAVARAFAEYRLDADEDESLRFSYRDLNDNLKKLSIRNLRKSFIKDYVTWMTGGAKGQKAMNKYVKAWFDAKLH